MNKYEKRIVGVMIEQFMEEFDLNKEEILSIIRTLMVDNQENFIEILVNRYLKYR